MSGNLVQTLSSLRDLRGIEGSFLVDASGGLLAQDLPAYFGEAAETVGPRARRLWEAFSLSGDIERCVLRYGAHLLSLRPIGGNLLTVVARAEVNMPALRMASNLVAKKLLGLAVVVRDTEPPPTFREPLGGRARPEAPEARGVRTNSGRAVYYRGKRIE